MATKTKTQKINQVFVVAGMRQTDWPTPADITTLLAADGEMYTWRANCDTSFWAQRVAPFAVGSILHMQALLTETGTLRNVRYSCEGCSFLGAIQEEKKDRATRGNK